MPEEVLDYVNELIQSRYVNTFRYYPEDIWQSDWNGDEVGWDDVLVVGLYRMKNAPVMYYVDTETSTILDAWLDEVAD